MRALCLLCLAAASIAAWGQPPARQDAKGCVESKIVSRMPGCSIARCENKDFASAPMPRHKGERNPGAPQVEGRLERTLYICPKDKSPLELGRNTESALRDAGFEVLYTDVYVGGKRFWMTARKGAYWVNLAIVGEGYDLTVVQQKAMEQVMTANADGWAKQVEQTGRVSVYGIHFDTGKSSIRADSEPALSEVAKLLQKNASWAMVVAGHTDNVGARDMNLGLSRQRAEAVIEWLAGHGVERSRLVAAGFGDTRPVAQNADDEGRQKNRRVDLVKLY